MMFNNVEAVMTPAHRALALMLILTEEVHDGSDMLKRWSGSLAALITYEQALNIKHCEIFQMSCITLIRQAFFWKGMII